MLAARVFLGLITTALVVFALGIVSGSFEDPSETAAIPSPFDSDIEGPEALRGAADSSTPIAESTSTSLTRAAVSDPNGSTTIPTSTTHDHEATTTRPNGTTKPTSVTTKAPPVTVVEGDLSLSSDLVLDGVTHHFSGHIEGNGHQVICMNGCRLIWSDFSVNDVARIMFHNGAGPADLRNGEVTNSGVAGEVGFYPLHWHLNGDSTRGTVVENVTVRNGQNHAFVPHGSHGISLLNTKAINTIGEPYWWDLPGSNDCPEPVQHNRRFCTTDNSNDILIDNAFVDGVVSPSYRVAGFMLGAGSGNVLRNSHGQNIANGVQCSVYQWPEAANLNSGGNVWVFQNNTAEPGQCRTHSHPELGGNAIFVWQNDGNHHVIQNFKSETGGIEQGAYGTPGYDFRHVDIAYLLIHSVDWRMTDSVIRGPIKLTSHTFEGDVHLRNVSAESVIVADAPSSSTANKPVELFIDGSNLTCANVQWTNPHPATRVIIDGQDC